MDLPNWDHQFLVIDRMRYPELPDINCNGMIYAPGLVCSYCGLTLKLGFVVQNPYTCGVYGRECIREAAVSPWRSLMQRARYYLDPWAFDHEEDLKPAQRKYLRGLSLLTQVQPWGSFAKAMFERMLDNYILTDRQREAVEKMITEQGGIDALLDRRDDIHRLSMLAKLPVCDRDDAEDRQKVESLLQQAWRKPLSEAQRRLIKAIEEHHYGARNRLTNKILDQWPLEDGKVDWTK